MQEVEDTCKGNYYESANDACDSKLGKVDEVIMKADFETNIHSFE